MYYITKAGVKFLNELTDKQIEDEEGEFKRVAHQDRRGVKKKRGSKTQTRKGSLQPHQRASTEREMDAAKKGKETTVKNLKGVGNTDAPNIKPGFSGLRKAVRILKHDNNKDREDRRRAFDQVKGHDKKGRKQSADASIVRSSGKGKKKKRELVAGNTRAMFAKALGKSIRIHKYKKPS